MADNLDHNHKPKEEHFMRTQSEVYAKEDDVIPPIHRTESKDNIYDMPPKLVVSSIDPQNSI